MAVGSIFFAFADTPDKYWSFVFPGMLISVTGLAAAYVGANITIMGDARKGEEVSFKCRFCQCLRSTENSATRESLVHS